jgi:hypothetical protein
MEEVEARAYAAWFQHCKRHGYLPDQPSQAMSGLEEYAGKEYVVLRNVRGVMAVYRVRNDGMLKMLKRWPASIEQEV